MYPDLVNPWRVIQLYETMSMIVVVVALVLFAVECISLLILCSREESHFFTWHRKRHLGRSSPLLVRVAPISVKALTRANKSKQRP